MFMFKDSEQTASNLPNKDLLPFLSLSIHTQPNAYIASTLAHTKGSYQEKKKHEVLSFT